MDLAQATRPIMWNIHAAWAMYALFGVALVVFAAGVYRRVVVWRQGKADDERLSDWGRRLGILIKEVLLQQRVRGSAVPGWFHSLIFYSFVVLVVTTSVVGLDYDFGTSLFKGWIYVLLTLGADVGGALILVGVVIAGARRYVVRPKTIETALDDSWALLLLALLVLTGFAVEALRIAVLGDRWMYLSPIGWALSGAFTGMSRETAGAVHVWLWWLHAVLAMAWIASIPFTKFFHLLALPGNVFFAKLGPRGALKRVDIEAIMTADDFDEATLTLGIAKAGDFTWKQRLDGDACISCGRCEEVCPSFQAGEPFSPKRFVHAGRDLVVDCARGATGDGDDLLIGNKLDERFIWFCRTCAACMEVCPAMIDHVDTMVEVRRNELMMQARAPVEASRALKMMESQGNPFGNRSLRAQWIQQMKVRVVPPGGDVDVLYWVGCLSTYDQSKQKIAADVFSLLERSGLTYGVLGADETCCGDPARLLGDERQFQEIAKAQVAAIQARTFRTLLVSCPHCFNVLANEYPQFGAKLKVVHHSQFLQEMVSSGVIRPSTPSNEKVVYHDPCYLGRYQGVYESPRKVLEAIPGVAVTEMADCKQRSFCCGGGGGHFWMDLKVEGAQRVNNLRVDQAHEAGAAVIATGCPYCHQMLDDSVKLRNLDTQMKVVDIATLLLDSVEERKPTASQSGR